MINFMLKGSPNKTTPKIMAMTTLSLSMGATQEAGAIVTHDNNKAKIGP